MDSGIVGIVVIALIVVGGVLLVRLVGGIVESVETRFRARRRLAAEAAQQRERAAQQRERNIRATIKQHVRELTLKRRQLVTPDHYGVLHTRRWTKEKQYFCSAVLGLSMSDSSRLDECIEEEIAAFEASQPASSPLTKSVDGLSPREHEHYCADLLTSNGWKTRVTKASGDQGADVIAEKGGVRVILQCKQHSQPVGNKAVQEVLAAMQFEDAEFGAVVSNAIFTRSATALAHKCGVALLHHADLATLTMSELKRRRK